QLEFKLRGLAQQVLERLRVLEAGHIDDDAIVALADDRRLARAERVDPLADDFRGAVHRAVERGIEARARLGEDEAAAIDHLEIPFAGDAGAVYQRQQNLARAIDIGGVFKQERQAAAGRRHFADANAWLGI